MFKIVFSFLLGLFVFSYAQDFDTVLRLPWSEADGIRYSELPEGRYGPQALSVLDDEIYLLDNQNNRLRIYRDQQMIKTYLIPEGVYNLYVSEEHLLAFNGYRVYSIDQGKNELLYSNRSKSPIKRVKQIGDILYLQNNKNQIHSIGNQQKNLSSGMEEFSYSDKVNSGTGRIHYTDQQVTNAFDITFPQNDLASIRVIGQDDSDYLYLVVERFVQHVPLEIAREICQYDNKGKLRNRILLPAKGFTLCANDLHVTSDGHVYFLYTTKDDLQIIRFDLSREEGRTIYFDRKQVPVEENRSDLYDESESYESKELKSVTFPEVTPEEALLTGDTYVQLNWSCTSANLTDGLITDSYGNLVRTPDWVTAGSHQNVVYKWGGFQTVEQFIEGLVNSKYAGDNYTNKGFGTSSAVGVDCSGFVSRCWNLPSQYSTRMMDDSITIAYDNWEDAKPGDAVHKEGHVRLIVENNPDGTITVVESAGYNWRVSYRTYTYAELYNYMPRYYINMQGTPGNVPQPRLATVLSSSEQLISWSIGGTDVISELKLYVAEDGVNWDQTYPVDKNLKQTLWPVGLDSCQFFKLTSVSDEDQTESLPSDVYGAFYNDTDEKILIIDGFDRTNATNGSWNHIYHKFVVEYGMALYSLGLPFETASNDAVLNEDVHLEEYAAVIWIAGDESTADETFSTSEQTIVENYLKGGGNLFISGSEVAWDLDYKGSLNDQNFFNNYFKADYLEDDSQSYSVTGTEETPFADLNIHYDDGSHGVYEEDYPDVLSAINGGKEALRYANGKLAAIYFEGLFPDGSAPGKLFYMGFPYETIYNENDRFALMGAIMSFFEFTINSVESDQPVIVKQFELLGNYPNPFNNSTTIRYSIPAEGSLTLEIFNSPGERVFRDKWSARMGSGEYILTAANWATGIYFYRLGYNERSFRQSRFILLK
jgi:hypothetical protein